MNNDSWGEVFTKWLRKRIIKVYFKGKNGCNYYYDGEGAYTTDVNHAAAVWPLDKNTIFLAISAKGQTPLIEYYVKHPKVLS